jgi:multisubunit Na+/H+ antiporter MnhE subunit
MKQLVAFITAIVLVYVLSSVLAGNWNIFEWHWAMRLIAVLWLLGTFSNLLKNNSDNLK